MNTEKKGLGMPSSGWIMTIISGIFWLLGLVPIVHFFTDIIYWIIWLFVFIHTRLEHLKNPKIIAVSGISFLLGLIPFVNWIPWSIAGTWISYKLSNK